MNVVIIHYAAPPIVGGVETVIARQAQQLDRSGHRVRILAGRGQTWDPRLPVEVRPLLDSRHPEVLQIKGDLDQGQIPSSFNTLVEEIKKELTAALQGVDVVICHNVASLNKNLALTAALHALSQEENTPHFILWHHDLAWTTPRYRSELHPGWPWDLLCTPWPGVRQVVVSDTRQEELAHLMRLPPKEIAVIPAGISMPDFLGLSPRIRMLVEKLDLHNSSPILLCPVRVTRRKNIELAIQVLGALQNHMPTAALVVTGPPGAHNPSNLAYLQELIDLRHHLGLDASVHLLAEHDPDGLTETEVADFYRLADVLIFTSREEGFGIPILEAGLSRMPIFCTNIPPLQALAREAAIYFSPDADPEEVARTISTRLSGNSAYQLRNRVKREFTWEAIYDQRIAPLLEPV